MKRFLAASASRRAQALGALALSLFAGFAIRAQDAGGTKPPTGAQLDALRGEFRKRRDALAKTDANGHFELAKWCGEVGLASERKTAMKQVLAIDTNHADARRELGYVQTEWGKWVLEEDLKKQQAKKEEEENVKKGLAKFEGTWVPKEEIPFLEKGMVRHETGWITKEDAERLSKGWKKVDEDWISPEEAPNVEKGLFKIGGQWVSKQEANALHADWERAWKVVRAHVLLRTNLDRDTADRLAGDAEAVYARLREIFAAEPKQLPLPIFGFRALTEYNRYASQFGSDHASAYGAYLSEADEDRPGVCMLENEKWSWYLVAHAVGHLFVDRLVDQAKAGDDRIVPAWFEEGIASYVERFFNDANRQYWLADLAKKGGLESPKLFAKSFGIDGANSEGASRTMTETGLVIDYYLSTADAKDRKLFADAVKAVAVGNRKEIEKAVEALIKDPAALDKKLRAHSGLK